MRSASYGAAIGASVLFVFGDDSLLAFYLLFEGAIIGGVIGAFVGLMIRRAVKMQRRTWQHNNSDTTTKAKHYPSG